MSRARRVRLWAVVVAIVAGSVLVYMEALAAMNGQAPTTLRPSGWVAVLQPTTEPGAPRIGAAGNLYTLQPPDHVGLDLASSAVGPHPYATYTVRACGPHRYTDALLLLGGSARLAFILPSPHTAPNPTVDVRTVHDLAMHLPNALESVRFGSVQVIRLYLPGVQPCKATPLFGGFATSYGLGGYLYQPIEEPWRHAWDWWAGPQLSQAWPLVGAIPGLTPSFEGHIVATKGITGAWDLPLQQSVRVLSAPIALSATVDTTSPALPSGTREFDWTSQTSPISPVAIITDTAATATLQTWLGLAALIAGAAVALALTLIVDALRAPSHARQPPPAPTPETHRAPSTFATAVAAALVAISVIRRRR